MNKEYPTPFTLSFPEATNIIVAGDIHGEFNQLVFKLCQQYKMHNTLLIVAGDCGFGFEKKESYELMVRKNAKRMEEANNWIVFIRGNHDNPNYFDGVQFMHSRFMAIPDYTVLSACIHTLLCIGGAISLDRLHRIKEWENRCQKNRIKEDTHDKMARNYYWQNEPPIFDLSRIENIHHLYSIDTVISHTAPTFCEPLLKENIEKWKSNDPTLIEDVKSERNCMDQIFNQLKLAHHPIHLWCYGHFHNSWSSVINNVLFKMLDIMEFYTIP